MNKKRENLELLLIYVAIGIIVAGVTAWFIYQNRIEIWKAQACDTFREALIVELKKRSKGDIYYAVSGKISLLAEPFDNKKEPIKVPMESKYGRKLFTIPYEKHVNNIERNSDIRLLHSSILNISPLKVDSLNATWRSLLDKSGVYGKTMVRICVADWWEHETYAYSNDSLYVTNSDSLLSYYVGYRCENYVTGYMYYHWQQIFTVKDKILLLALIFCCFLLFFMQETIIRIYRYLFIKEVPVIVEKEVPVIHVGKSEVHIYRLGDDVCFDTDSGKLSKGDACVKLTPILAKLLQGFLEAEDYRLSINEIMELLWPNSPATSDRVHTTIKRLRQNLFPISGWRIENGNSSYQLKSPHSIEENA